MIFHVLLFIVLAFHAKCTLMLWTIYPWLQLPVSSDISPAPRWCFQTLATNNFGHMGSFKLRNISRFGGTFARESIPKPVLAIGHKYMRDAFVFGFVVLGHMYFSEFLLLCYYLFLTDCVIYFWIDWYYFCALRISEILTSHNLNFTVFLLCSTSV